ncbi:hypothetical protein AL705_05440 [Lawsonella clevelandensis]|uniref:Uncharacterized protein n=1 Tax=Lawsonella clevelandensis TaxID=1528099 RepID=A0A0M3TBL9_9ACTN|nr:hypothetical protein AL705_05440 [Lawsonella clevelandensis]
MLGTTWPTPTRTATAAAAAAMPPKKGPRERRCLSRFSRSAAMLMIMCCEVVASGALASSSKTRCTSGASTGVGVGGLATPARFPVSRTIA